MTHSEAAQRHIFGNLLRAVYNIPIVFNNFGQAFQLQILTDMAEYYCALPLISRCVDAIINGTGTSDPNDTFSVSPLLIRFPNSNSTLFLV